jgi:DNA adenine methylase
MQSNSDIPAIRELYSGFRIETVQANRAINCNGDKRGRVNELIILNY